MFQYFVQVLSRRNAVADPEGPRGPCPTLGPVKINHKKDGRQRRPHRFHVSCPPPLTRPLDPLLKWYQYRQWLTIRRSVIHTESINIFTKYTICGQQKLIISCTLKVNQKYLYLYKYCIDWCTCNYLMNFYVLFIYLFQKSELRQSRVTSWIHFALHLTHSMLYSPKPSKNIK